MENTIIEYLKVREPELLDKITSTFAEYKKLDFMSIRQSDIIVLTPERAYEYKGNEGDKYFKIWMAGDTIAFCTWANSMIDSCFRWNSKDENPDKKRNNADIIGNEPHISAFIKSKSAINKCTLVYMFPFASFSAIKPAVTKTEKKEKSATAREKKERIPQEYTKEQKIEKLIDNLSKLSTSIEGRLERNLACKDDITDFNNNLMRLKVLDKTNEMIPYFENMSKNWDYKKNQKGLLESILDALF